MIETIFSIVMAELVLGGGGRTFSIGSLSLRMLLFGAMIAATLVGAISSARKRDGFATANLLVLAFFASLIPGLLVDAAWGTPARIVLAGIQPILFWLTAPFFTLALQDVKTIRRGGTIITYGGVAVAVVTTILTIGLYVGFVGFGSLYVWANQTEEMFFRGTTNFFYKGHFFVGISLIFCVIMAPRWWRIMVLVLIASLALSLTRGLFVAVAIALALSFVSQRRHIYIIAALIVSVIVAAFYGHFVLDILFDPTRVTSSQTRSRDISYFIMTFDYDTLLFGDGLGSLLNGRSSVENSYLWVIWRFGILGLIFTLVPLFMSISYYFKVPRSGENYKLASAFFFGIVMLYILTAFNPFINNSIGLMYLFCALFSLRRLSRVEDGVVLSLGVIA
jgi:hypothetical protein